MSRVCQGPRWSSTPGLQCEEQSSLESDMGELIGNDDPAEDPQAIAIRDRFKRPIVDFSNQFSAGQHAKIQPQSCEPPYETKNPIGPVGFLERYSVILHESPQ